MDLKYVEDSENEVNEGEKDDDIPDEDPCHIAIKEKLV